MSGNSHICLLPIFQKMLIRQMRWEWDILSYLFKSLLWVYYWRLIFWYQRSQGWNCSFFCSKATFYQFKYWALYIILSCTLSNAVYRVVSKIITKARSIYSVPLIDDLLGLLDIFAFSFEFGWPKTYALIVHTCHFNTPLKNSQ